MSQEKNYLVFISEDALFSKKLRRGIQETSITKDWRYLCFGQNNIDKDFPLNKLFIFLQKNKSDKIVICIDFDANYTMSLDILKIIQKYSFTQEMIKVGAFGDQNTKRQIEITLSHGCQIADYKRPEVGDILTNILLLKDKSYEELPEYATAPGENVIYWGEFFGKVNYIGEENLSIAKTFGEVHPNDSWMDKFLPKLTQSQMIDNSKELDRKYKWLESYSSFKFYFENKKLLNCESIKIHEDVKTDEKSVENINGVKEFKKGEEQAALNDFQEYIKSIKLNQTRVMAFDNELVLMQEYYMDANRDYNLFTFPFLLANGDNAKKINPDIIVVEWDRLTVLDDNNRVIKLDTDGKIDVLKHYIEQNVSENTVVIFFGLKDEQIPKFASKQFNLYFDINIGFFNKMIDIYEKKGGLVYKLNNSLNRDELQIAKVNNDIRFEVPLVLLELNEHRILFETPMPLEEFTLVKMSFPCTYYVLVLNKLGEKGQYGGIILGVNEHEKSIIRQEVNRILRIPKEQEENVEKVEYLQKNMKEFVKRQKSSMKKEKDKNIV